MDPVTVLSLVSGSAAVAKLLFQTGESLHKFIDQTRSVDQSLQALQREATALSRSLGAVATALSQPVIKGHGTILHDYSLLWTSLDDSIRDCKDTAILLQQHVETLQSKKGFGVFSQAWRTYRFSLKADDISTVRAQIASHYLSVQLCLQTISV